MVVPETKIFAPAFIASGAVSKSIPPSISISILSFSFSILDLKISPFLKLLA